MSLIPNQFPKPVPPNDFGLAAFDATYSMAPFFLGPDEALVMTGALAEVPHAPTSRSGTASCRR